MSFFFVRLKLVLSLPPEIKFLSIDFSPLTMTNAEIIPTNGIHFKLYKLVSPGVKSKS